MQLKKTIIFHTLIATIALAILASYFSSQQTEKTIIAVITLVSILHYYSTQISIKQAKTKSRETKSKQTANVIFAAYLVAFLLSLFLQQLNLFVSAIGIILIVSGTLAYSRTIMELKEFFSTDIEIKQKHKLITTGAFAIVRNPAYLSSAIFYIGMALAANSLACIAIFLIGFLPWYAWRIMLEEKMLSREFGKEFEKYKKRVPMLLPKLF